MDFGSTFGSGSVDLQLPNLSFQYWLDFDEVTRNLTSFGLRTPYYRRVKWPEFPKYEAVGRWESEFFEPQAWRNDYPNPAFVRMSDRDAFWAAKIIMRFTRDELAAIVETGEISDPEASRYFLETLIERQHKTARYYMDRLNPIDEFDMTAEGLRFVNLSEHYGLAGSDTTYRVQWSVYDDRDGTTRELGSVGETVQTTLPLPEASGVTAGGEQYLVAEIHSENPEHPGWNRRVGVYLRPVEMSFAVVGIERASDPPDGTM